MGFQASASQRFTTPYPSTLSAQLAHLGSRLGVVAVLADGFEVRIVVTSAQVQRHEMVDLGCLAKPAVALAFLAQAFVAPENALPNRHPCRAASPTHF